MRLRCPRIWTISQGGSSGTLRLLTPTHPNRSGPAQLRKMTQLSTAGVAGSLVAYSISKDALAPQVELQADALGTLAVEETRR
jgi:hypothetical protein